MSHAALPCFHMLQRNGALKSKLNMNNHCSIWPFQNSSVWVVTNQFNNIVVMQRSINNVRNSKRKTVLKWLFRGNFLKTIMNWISGSQCSWKLCKCLHGRWGGAEREQQHNCAAAGQERVFSPLTCGLYGSPEGLNCHCCPLGSFKLMLKVKKNTTQPTSCFCSKIRSKLFLLFTGVWSLWKGCRMGCRLPRPSGDP